MLELIGTRVRGVVLAVQCSRHVAATALRSEHVDTSELPELFQTSLQPINEQKERNLAAEPVRNRLLCESNCSASSQHNV